MVPRFLPVLNRDIWYPVSSSLLRTASRWGNIPQGEGIHKYDKKCGDAGLGVSQVGGEADLLAHGQALASSRLGSKFPAEGLYSVQGIGFGVKG